MFLKDDKTMNIKSIAKYLITGVILAVLGYAIILITITWPISVFSINNAGVFGDSFGILTSLFSGLAFSGMIITILLQREELQLQRKELSENRKEFAKSANAQERNAQLSALASLLSDYKSQISKVEINIDKNRDSLNRHRKEEIPQLELDKGKLVERKESIVIKIEEILQDTGIQL